MHCLLLILILVLENNQPIYQNLGCFSPSHSPYSSRTTNIQHTRDYHFESQQSHINTQINMEETKSSNKNRWQTIFNTKTTSHTPGGPSKIGGRQNAIDSEDSEVIPPQTNEPNGNTQQTPIGDIPWEMIPLMFLVYAMKRHLSDRVLVYTQQS